MTNENDTDPLTMPPREETDPNYPGRNGERVSYGAVMPRAGSDAIVQTDPNFLTAPKEPSVPQPSVVIARVPMPPPGTNDSIDELIDGLPIDAALPKKTASAALPKAAVPSKLLPPVIVDVKTEPPQHRKARVDNSTVVTPAGLELKTQRWVTAGIAVAIGLGILLWMINWSAGPSRVVQEPEITTTEAQHAVKLPPVATMTAVTAPPQISVPAIPVVVESEPSDIATHAPPTPSGSTRSPRPPASAPPHAEINEFKPSIRH